MWSLTIRRFDGNNARVGVQREACPNSRRHIPGRSASASSDKVTGAQDRNDDTSRLLNVDQGGICVDVGDSGMGDFIRTFPVLLRDQEGHKWRVLFDSWAVHKGMVSIPYRLDAQSDTYSESVNITIGHEYFTSGMQNLILEYRTRNEIHVSQGKATLERNMTGIWPGPLDSVVAQV